MKLFDITILTDKRYVAPTSVNAYVQNVLDEDRLLSEALKECGLKVFRTNWDNPNFDWSSTKYVLFRTTWDYFDRYPEFSKWLEDVDSKTSLINPKELIYWNIDKHYLNDLKSSGIRIADSIFIERGDKRTLHDFLNQRNWNEVVLKPTISGAARHTYRFLKENYQEYNSIFEELIAREDMIIQEFQHQIVTKGEVSYMLFGGKYSHAISKKAKAGDYRVQDDFGGTISNYSPTQDEISYAEKVISVCSPQPIYARVDIFWNNQDELTVGELELIEPELWFRLDEQSASRCAGAISNYIKS